MITAKAKHFEVDQAIECAVINFSDSVGGEFETDQIFASIETFNRHNLIVRQINPLDKYPCVIEALDLGDALVQEVDFIRLTNILLVVPHLDDLGTRVLIFSSGPILVEEVGMD